MPLTAPQPLSIALAVATFCLVLLAERLHFRRTSRVSRLALGPSGEVRRWVRAAGTVRAVCLGCMTWSLLTLYFARGGIYLGTPEPGDDDGLHRVVFLADLSPSMHLQDAGPDGQQLRIERMHDVVDGVLQRMEGQVAFSVICFYTDALPAVIDARDSELVRNIFAGLPVWYVMESGKTDLGAGVRAAIQQLREYPPGSTTLFVCTDGDCVSVGPLPARAASIDQVYVLGVGDPDRGTFIDDHLSRQDAAVLTSLAGRLGGVYLDVNTRHVPTYSLGSLATGGKQAAHRWGLVDLAIYVFAVSATLLAILPIALALFGSDWRAVRPQRNVSIGAGRSPRPEQAVLR